MSLAYLSVCSGIEAATVAWHPLGFRPLAFSEIEPFACAVLAHHYAHVPLHGDFTGLRDEDWIAGADLLVGGTPCQAFSVAGLRQSLADSRGNLSLEFVRLADAIDRRRAEQGLPPCIVLWENVPGVLSVRDNAFGCFLSGLSGEDAPFDPPRGKWTNAGVALGPARAVAWRILDAQYFGLAQRRRRVFVVASARAGFDPAAVLLEFEGLRRDSPPRREARQDTAAGTRCRSSVSSGSGWWSDSGGLGATIRAQDSVTKADTLVHGGSRERNHWDGAEHPHPTLNQSFNTGAIGYSNQELFSQRGAGLVGDVTAARMVAFGEYAEDGTASTVKSRDYKDATDLVAQPSTGSVSHCLNAGGMGRQDFETETLVTHALRAEGFDASEDGTGRGTPLVPVQAFYSTESRCDNFPPPDVSPPLKVGSNGGGQPPAIAFSSKDHGADASVELAPTLRAMPHDASHANGGGQMAVAFAQNTRDELRLQGGDGQIAGALAAEPGMKQTTCVAVPLLEVGKRTGVSTDDPRAGAGVGDECDPMFTLQAGAQHGVAYPIDLRNAGRDPDKKDDVNRQGLGLGEDGDPSPTISTAFVPGVAAYGFQPRIARNGRGDTGDIVNALNAQSGGTGKGDAAPCVAVADTLGVGANQTSGFESEVVAASMAVRRLTPEECEALQGFPRGYTRIPWKKKQAEDCPDGPRYRALGNSMAVNVMRWIGARIQAALDEPPGGNAA